MAWTCPTVKRSPFPRLQAFRSLLHRFKAYLSGQERSWQHMDTPMVRKIFFCYCCYYYIWDLLVGSQADEALHFVALSNFVLDPLALVPSHPSSTLSFFWTKTYASYTSYASYGDYNFFWTLPKLTLLTLLTLLTGAVIFFEPFQNLRFLHFLRRKLGFRSGILLTTTDREL